MNDEQDSGPKSQVPGSKSAGGSSDATSPVNSNSEGLDARSTASEIAGETVDVVGEATGEFPRAPAVERSEKESTGKSAFMVGAGILEGDLVQVRRQPTAENGDVVVALVGEEGVVKRLRRHGRVYQLESANPKHPPIAADFQVVGKVVGLVRRYGK